MKTEIPMKTGLGIPVGKKRLLFWICMLLIVLFSTLPVTSGQTPELTVNVMALQGSTGLTLVKMLQDQPTLGENVTTHYTLIKSADQIVSKIISGEADIAALPTNLAAVLYNKGIKIQIFAITNWGLTYVVGRDGTIQTWPDLKGKKVAVTGQGATPDLLFHFLAEANGLEPSSDLNIRYYPTPVELGQLVIAGKVDVAVLPEPWVSQVLMKDSSAKILLDFQTEWKKVQNRDRSYPQSCLVVKREFAQKHPEFMTAFSQEASASSAWVNQNPAPAGILAEEYISIQAEAGRLAIPRCNLDFIKALDVKEEIEYFLRTLHQYNPTAIGERMPDADFYQ